MVRRFQQLEIVMFYTTSVNTWCDECQDEHVTPLGVNPDLIAFVEVDHMLMDQRIDAPEWAWIVLLVSSNGHEVVAGRYRVEERAHERAKAIIDSLPLAGVL